MKSNNNDLTFNTVPLMICLGLYFCAIFLFSMKSKPINLANHEKIQDLVNDKYYYKEVADSSGDITSYIFLIENDEEYMKLEFAREYTTITNTCTAENAYVKYFENDVREISYAEICLPKKE